MESESHEALMATAERLFAEQCIDAVSLRQINREAGQKNHSAVHYHFGDKMGLLGALCEYRNPLLVSCRQSRLQAVADPPELRDLLDALLGSLVDVLDAGGGCFLRLRHQMLLSPDPEVRALVTSTGADDPSSVLRASITTTLDYLPPAEVGRRLHHCRLLAGARIAELVGERDDERAAVAFRDELPALLEELVGLMTASAPAV